MPKGERPRGHPYGEWRLITMRRFLLGDVFPDENSFCDSRWGSWNRRIQRAHTAEEKQIERIYNERKKRPSLDPSYDPDEWAGEDYMETCRLTNSMYAALVVSIWSEMEHFLKDVVSALLSGPGEAKDGSPRDAEVL